ncbi:MAG: hypothetical protein R3C17_05215 [Planctomycetaceae bacterium]
MQAPAEPQAERHRDSDVLRDHCLHADCFVDGRKPTKRTFEMICFYFCGLASEDELMAHIEKL